MTREEVHDLMENELRCVQRGNYCDRDCAKCPLVKEDKELIEAYGYVIKALEQEPFINKTCVSSGVCEHDKQKVLDKIRAEIEEYQKDAFYSDGVMMPRKMILDIIDKYKAESKLQESEDT